MTRDESFNCCWRAQDGKADWKWRSFIYCRDFTNAEDRSIFRTSIRCNDVEIGRGKNTIRFLLITYHLRTSHHDSLNRIVGSYK